jgi:hypothetical protein
MSDRTDMLERATCLPDTPPPLSMVEDVIDVVEATLRFPAHLNVNSIEKMPVQ